MALDDAWLKDLLTLAATDLDSALSKVVQSGLTGGEKQGVSMALKGIVSSQDGFDSGKPRPSTEQLSKIQDGVLLDPIDLAYTKTWLSYAKGLAVVKDEGGVKGDDHEPQEKEGPHALGVQLSLSAYGFADESPGEKHAEEVEDD